MKTGNPDYQNNWLFGFSAFQNYIFCRVLDIRVPQIMETEVGESGVFRDRFETVCNVVRCQPHSISGCLPAKVNTKLWCGIKKVDSLFSRIS